MKLDPAQTDRACGVLLGSAVGDALGAGYEFTFPAADVLPVMKGGGLGNFAPGEWTDDTAQAFAIARVAATGADLRSQAALSGIAQGFADWYAAGPADVGIQTAHVLRLAGPAPTGASMAAAALAVHEASGRSAGNGSLMRTGPVALAYLDDPVGLVEAAIAISELTHYQDLAAEACAVWCLMIRHAVLNGDFPKFSDIAEWVPNPDRWLRVLAEAEAGDPSSFTTNAWSIGAMQAAWSAITHTPVPAVGPACAHLIDALGTAIRIGHDTDTVAAIAGALLGARWGMSAIPAQWRRILHGWDDADAAQLEQLAVLTVNAGRPIAYGWPTVERIDYERFENGLPALVQHPYDEGVWLGSASALDRLPAEVDAVVSLCLTGMEQVPDGVEQITFRLLDEAAVSANPNLEFVLADAAQTIAALREEGRSVLVHCVAAHSRTPAVGVAYAMHRGVRYDDAIAAVCDSLPAARPNAGFRSVLSRSGQSD